MSNMFSADLARFQGAKFRETLLAYIYDGESIAEACGWCKVNPAAFGLYCLQDKEFDLAFRKALAFRVDIDVDRLGKIDQEIDNPVMASVISKNIQWLATKRSRELYGEKVDHTLNVQINIRAAMDDARNRTLEHRADKPLIQLDHSTDNISDAQYIEAQPPEEIDPLS